MESPRQRCGDRNAVAEMWWQKFRARDAGRDVVRDDVAENTQRVFLLLLLVLRSSGHPLTFTPLPPHVPALFFQSRLILLSLPSLTLYEYTRLGRHGGAGTK